MKPLETDADRRAWTRLLIVGIVLIVAGVSVSIMTFGSREVILASVSTGLITGGLVLLILSILRPPRRW